MATSIAQPNTQIAFEDLSGGIPGEIYENPYDLTSLEQEIQKRYATHRETRNEQQRAKLLDPAFSGVLIDPILSRLEDPSIEPGFQDPRHCLVLWGRPPQRIRELIMSVQQKLKVVAPGLWLMPAENMHITAMEITHSKTDAEIAELVGRFSTVLKSLVDYTKSHSPRLINPMIGYDAQALALSFVPAAGEEPLPAGRTREDDRYSYHHLRRDLHKQLGEAGVEVGSRYVVPSAHLTIARFIDACDFQDDQGKNSPERLGKFIETIEEINQWLREHYWTRAGGESDAQWRVGEEKGLDCREGQLWYGGGRSIAVGEAI